MKGEIKMNTKTCKSCGRTNFPEAAFCSNCHQTLEQSTNNPVEKKQAKSEKSNKLYWILGGVGAVVVIGGFFITALAVGIYYYASPTTIFEGENFNTDSNVTAKKLSGDDKNTDKPDNKKNDKSRFGSKDWKSVIESKHTKLGKYKLQSVSKIEEKEKMIFKESADEAFALYSTNDKKPLEILFSVANFSTISDAKSDVDAIKQKIKTAKNGKIIKESKLSDGVIITYRKNKLIGILDCKDKTCTQTTGVNGTKVSDFYKQVTNNVF